MDSRYHDTHLQALIAQLQEKFFPLREFHSSRFLERKVSDTRTTFRYQLCSMDGDELALVHLFFNNVTHCLVECHFRSSRIRTTGQCHSYFNGNCWVVF